MQPLVIRIENVETHQVSIHAFNRSPVTVGRTSLNNLALVEPFVSNYHALVRFDDEAIKYIDLGSTNGTTRDGKRLPKNEPVTLDERAKVEIGPLHLQFSRDPVLAAEAEKQPKSLFGASLGETPPEEGEPDATRVLVSPIKGPQVPTISPAPALPVSAVPFIVPMPKGVPLQPQDVSEDEDEHNSGTFIINSPWAELAKQAAPGNDQPPRPSLAPPNPKKEPPQAGLDMFLSAAQQLLAGLEALPESDRAKTVAELKTQLRLSRQEAPLRKLLATLGLSPAPAPSAPAPAGPGSRDDGATKLLARFARSYLPRSAPPSSAKEGEKLLERVADALETCTKAFIELRKGHDQFGEQMGIRTIREETRLHRATDSREVLEYILDWTTSDDARMQELMHGFTDIMLHEIALMNGIRDGVRGLLSRVSPETIEGAVGAKPWPLRNGACWKTYAERFANFAEEGELMSIVFGREFARSYATIMGSDDSGSEVDPVS